MIRPRSRSAGLALLLAVVLAAALAPWLATNPPDAQFPDFVLAPPMLPRVVDAAGTIRAPFVYPLRLEDRLARTFSVDVGAPRPVVWLRGGAVASIEGSPWFPLGTDSLGRDMFARVLLGARLSLGVAAIATGASIAIGTLLGGLAGAMAGRTERLLMTIADFVIGLPGIYVALTLRASLPLVLSTAQVFWAMAFVLALVGWPLVARGVRGIVSVERTREYAEAARASGAGPVRLLLHHLLPASAGFLGTQATLLVPAFILAEATLSYVGLGFTQRSPSWGAMLASVERGRVLAEAPWLLAPAFAIAVTVLGINLLTTGNAPPGATSTK